MADEMFIYEIYVSGYECYEPCFFATNLSKEKFEEELVASFEHILPKLLKSEFSIDGHVVLDEMTNRLKKCGFRLIKPNVRFNLYGECLYSRDCMEEKPNFIPQKLWDQVLDHNKTIHDEVYAELEGK